MENRAFTAKERKRFQLKKYCKDHWFEYAVELVVNVLLVLLILYLCGGTKYLLGALMAVVYSIAKTLYTVYIYKKEYLDMDIKEE